MSFYTRIDQLSLEVGDVIEEDDGDVYKIVSVGQWAVEVANQSGNCVTISFDACRNFRIIRQTSNDIVVNVKKTVSF